MKSKLSVDLLGYLAVALQKPTPKQECGFYGSVLSHAAREGWVSRSEIEDVILETDSRLYGLDILAFSEAAMIPARTFFPRPTTRENEVMGQKGFVAADAAALLIRMRQLGFSIDPEPLVSLVLPSLKLQPCLSDAELAVFWFNNSPNRKLGFTLQADSERPTNLRKVELTTATDHQVEIYFNQDDQPWTLSVSPPKRKHRSGLEVSANAARPEVAQP